MNRFRTSTMLRMFKRSWVAAVAACVIGHGAAYGAPGQSSTNAAELALADRLNSRAVQLAKAGKFAEAEPLFTRALAIREQALGPDDLRVASVLNNMGAMYASQGKFAKAEPLLRRCLAIRDRTLDPEHLLVAQTVHNLASLCKDQRKYTEADSLFKRCLATYEKAFGPEHPRVAEVLQGVATVRKAQGQPAEAERLLKRALAIKQEALGADHPAVADTLNDLAGLYYSRGDYIQAEAFYKHCLAIRERALGKTHWRLGTALHNLAQVYVSQRRHADAIPLYVRLLAIQERTFGPDHVDVAQTLNNLGGACAAMGRFSQAEPVYRRALAIREKRLGPNHPLVAGAVTNVGLACMDQGKHAEAEQFLKRAVALYERIRGREHPDVAEALNHLAVLRNAQGRGAEALALHARAQAMFEKTLAPDDRRLADNLNNLAGAHLGRGDYARALALYEQACAIWEKGLGPNHPRLAAGLSNLGSVYRRLGKYAEAERLHKRALAIRTKVQGPDHPDVATVLNNLAVLYRSQGKLALSAALHKRSLALWEKAYGPDHPDVAAALSNLAGCYADRGKYAEAERAERRALAIREKVFGPDHPSVATTLNGLGWHYYVQGRFAEAQAPYERALAIRERALGRDHPALARSLTNLALNAVALGRNEAAWTHARRARDVLLAARRRAAGTPLARASFLAEENVQGFLPCLALKLGKPVDVLELIEQERTLALRELLAEARVRTSSALDPRDRDRVTSSLARLNALHTEVANARRLGHPLDAPRRRLNQAEREHDALMADLGERHQQYVALATVRGITTAEIRKNPLLDDATAIVGWTGFATRVTGYWSWAYVIRSRGVEWVDLTERMKSFDEVRLAGKASSANRRREDPRTYAPDLVELYRRRFAPLEPHLRGVKRVIVVASAFPYVIPIEMLLTEEPARDENDPATWAWLCNRYEISYAPSVTTLDLLCRQRAGRQARPRPRPLLVLADPPFAEDHLAQMKVKQPQPDALLSAIPPSEQAALTRGLKRALRFDRTAPPPRLPGTRREAQILADLFGKERTLLMLGPEATERRLFEASEAGLLRECRYVHIATHGLTDGDRPELSALVLARVPPDGDYDGLLQMREAFHLKLDADLVVLSACQTGLGRRMPGEGMVGLSTAFFFAGTPSLVTSLWNVSDVSTALLMHRFYTNLRSGRPKSTALREAKAWLRTLRRSDIRRLAGRTPLLADVSRGLGPEERSPEGEALDDRPFAHPYHWAGFVLTGDPR